MSRRGTTLLLAMMALAACFTSGCSGCENSVCCSLPGRVVPGVLRPSQCTAMSGTAVAVAMCDVICCEASDGTFAPGPRMTCTRVVDPRLCDTPDGG